MGAAINIKIASTKVTQISVIVLLVVFSLDVICPKKNRFSPLYLCSGAFAFHATIKLLLR